MAGCIQSVESEDIATAEEASLTANALTANALTANALTANALTANALTANALTGSVLTANQLTVDALRDPAARTVLKYIVGCALPAGSHIDFEVDRQPYHFEGQIGLAQEWGELDGTCDEECQGWVSACVLARVNFLGVAVPISIRGPAEALQSTPAEQAMFPVLDGVYYGNIFTTPQVRDACMPHGAVTLLRGCGPSVEGCVHHVVGYCDDVCSGRDRLDGAYNVCRDADGNNFRAPVTVFLQK